MGWAVGFDSHWNRDIGYGVPAWCDYPYCNELIDRGLANVCGSEPYGGEQGCGLHFCAEHLSLGRSKHAPFLCTKCFYYKQPYKPKPDHPDWIKWKMTDDSWAKWREENGIQI